MPSEKVKNSRALAALLSSLISQLLLLLLLLFPSSNPLCLLNSFSSPHQFIFPLLLPFFSTSEIATTFSLLSSFPRKRKRTEHSPDSDDPTQGDESTGSEPDSVIPRNPDSYKQFFKMNCTTFEWLCGLLEPLLDCRDPVQSPLNLPVETRLGIGLFRLATGSDFLEVARRFHVSELIAKFCVKQLCRVLCTNYRFWVEFPSTNELPSLSTQFEKLAGLPNCCGIIDCARFKIKGSNSIIQNSPPEDTVAAQIVVDASSRILSVTAGFRGNKSKLTVLNSSTLYKDIERGVRLHSQTTLYVNNVGVPQYLIGGGGYPLLPWLLVPYADPLGGSSEENFNRVVKIIRVPMLKTIASLRGWGVLSRPIDAEFKPAVANIGACSILHNMLLTREDYSAFCDEVCDFVVDDQSFDYTLEENLNEKGSAIRNALATTVKRV